MNCYLPWYHRASCLQLMVYGGLASFVLMAALKVAFDFEEAKLMLSIMLDAQESAGMSAYAVIGRLFGWSLSGMLLGAWGFWELKKKRRGSP